MKAQLRRISAWIRLIIPETRRLFSLHADTDEASTVALIKANVEFRGANLWILILAIFVASVGLNVNSTAVIIGAMLISPLMGPIVGSGLALGTNDFELLKRSLRHLGVAAVISILTSALYFALSPLSEANSELLARTSPTLYDVLIALFGGAAGMVGGSRKERGNAVPGVAIATALMPPLCTAGFGLARLDISFFLGALYLFFINSVFICWASFLVVRVLNFQKVALLEKIQARKVQLYMTGFVVITMIPSIYTAYTTVQAELFDSNARKFLSRVMSYENSKLVDTKISGDSRPQRIEVSVMGLPLTEAQKEQARAQLKSYGLESVDLVIHDAGASVANEMEKRIDSKMKSSLLSQLYEQHEVSLKARELRIEVLESELLKYKEPEKMGGDLAQELGKISPKILSISFGAVPSFDLKGTSPAVAQSMLFVRWRNRPTAKEKVDLESYVRVRLAKQPPIVIHQ